MGIGVLTIAMVAAVARPALWACSWCTNQSRAPDDKPFDIGRVKHNRKAKTFDMRGAFNPAPLRPDGPAHPQRVIDQTDARLKQHGTWGAIGRGKKIPARIVSTTLSQRDHGYCATVERHVQVDPPLQTPSLEPPVTMTGMALTVALQISSVFWTEGPPHCGPAVLAGSAAGSAR